jgi:hypothetical protein
MLPVEAPHIEVVDAGGPVQVMRGRALAERRAQETITVEPPPAGMLREELLPVHLRNDGQAPQVPVGKPKEGTGVRLSLGY